MALVMQDHPCAQLLDHPHLAAGSGEGMTAPVDIPLVEALAACGTLGVTSHKDVGKPPKKKVKQPEGNMKIHAYSKATDQKLETAEETEEKFSREIKLINHQNCIIGELIAMTRALTERVNQLEGRITTQDDTQEILPSSVQEAEAPNDRGDGDNKTKTCGKKSLPKRPSTIWFEWYAKTPRMWDVCNDRQKKSAYKQTVNYMKLFLPKGFVLDPSTPGYCDEVLRYGIEIEDRLVKFFNGHGIKRKNGSSVLKQPRKFYHEGKLDAVISAYRARVVIGGTTDPAPQDTQDLITRT
ncbi:hypothetical protein AM587_10016902 [Phytophthora nicotianae]|uniref:Uncharacterized protein n=1 Tax=Phytophthora nicotianae TaxID=4792 RepID=A0A0W8AYT2_PHYNI|nr:hypothetical protein AM587_10016902 [Phytophthora nicotianae]